jgi:hypothetical protein
VELLGEKDMQGGAGGEIMMKRKEGLHLRTARCGARVGKCFSLGTE